MNHDLLTSADQAQLLRHGLTPEEGYRQIHLFRDPPPFIRLERPCVAGDGIKKVEDAEVGPLVGLWEEAARAGRITKFVPASGSATRMFQCLLAYRNHPAAAGPKKDVQRFLENLPRFAFHEALSALLPAHAHGDADAVLSAVLDPQGLNYKRAPKALVLFHRYSEGARSALEEHVRESPGLLSDAHGICRVHFTISPEHRDDIVALLTDLCARLESPLKVRFEISVSVQKGSTDTLAVDSENRPFRDGCDGTLVLRPAGHGALIENLNDLRGDIVVIKNIDNLKRQEGCPFGMRWKQVLVGHLIRLEQRCFSYAARLDEADAALLDDALGFLASDLCTPTAQVKNASRSEKQAFLRQRLFRPLRVCGMVRNQGEPGGGPFFVKGTEGHISQQIVEAAQVDPQAQDQQAIWRSSTHFNPVDLVTSVRDFRGTPFDLLHFIDPRAILISHKSRDGHPLKALERPGLWNGAMAGWNTAFVEVPHETFNPVKTVFDLLRPAHQPE